MKKIKLLFLLIVSFLILGVAQGKSRLESIKYRSISDKVGTVSIRLKGDLTSTPELMVRDTIVQVAIPGAVVCQRDLIPP